MFTILKGITAYLFGMAFKQCRGGVKPGITTSRWLAAVAFDYGVIIAAILAFQRWPGFLMGFAAVLLIGTRQHGITILGHDGAHGSICKSRWLNDALTGLCFRPLGISLARYRKFHFAHHRYLGTPRDPERALKALVAPVWDLPPPPAALHILWLSAKDFLIWPALREVLPFMALVASPVAVARSLTIWLLILVLGGWWPLVLWFAALSTSFWASNRLRIWTEHQGTNGTHCVSATWWQRFAFLPHNIGWHLEHHAAPGVAFYNLPSMRRHKALSVGDLFAWYGQQSRVPLWSRNVDVAQPGV